MINTKQKGDFGVGVAIEYFTSKSYVTLLPLTDSQDYDIVVDIDGTLKKVQAKFTNYKRNEYECSISIKGGTKGSVWKKASEVDFDMLFVTDGDGSSYFIPRKFIPISGTVTLGNKYEDYKVKNTQKNIINVFRDLSEQILKKHSDVVVSSVAKVVHSSYEIMGKYIFDIDIPTEIEMQISEIPELCDKAKSAGLKVFSGKSTGKTRIYISQY